MKFETKFDLDEEAYFFDGDIVKREKIILINITSDIVTGTTKEYLMEGSVKPLQEKQLFKTTKDLYKHVEKEVKKLLKDKE